MKSIDVAHIAGNVTIQNAKEILNEISLNEIDNVCWPDEYPYKPAVSFQIAHTDTSILLHYTVEEEFVKAQFIRPNENVWEDSCVEFFLSLDNKKNYYNFEFNVLGTAVLGYGPGVKSERNRLEATVINTIDTYTEVLNIQGKKVWDIFISIPKAIFGDVGFSAKTFHANFYKCGDTLPTPHFISWNKIDNPTPNFHLPQFFGDLNFK